MGALVSLVAVAALALLAVVAVASDDLRLVFPFKLTATSPMPISCC